MSKLYIIAGEASGDVQVSGVVEALLQQAPSLKIRARGGEQMQAAGAELDAHFKDTAFMGLTDVLMNLGKIRRAIQETKRAIKSFGPDALLLVDYPGFNFRIAKWAKSEGIPIYYFIPPKVWAWKAGRINDLKDFSDKTYLILPFEQKLYSEKKINFGFFGNPLYDLVEQHRSQIANHSKKTIALLPGSRVKEVKKLLPDMLELVKQYPDYHFQVTGMSILDPSLYSGVKESGAELIMDNTYDVLANAHAAIVASGTASLEAALFQLPQVVIYKTDALSYFIGKRLVDLDYFSLANLIGEQKVVPELLQAECSNQNIRKELDAILSEQGRSDQLEGVMRIKNMLGPSGVAKRIAKDLLEQPAFAKKI